MAVASWQQALGISLDCVEGVLKSVPSSSTNVPSPGTGLYILPDACTPHLRLKQLAMDLSNFTGMPVLCPSRITVWASLIESLDMVTMNEVIVSDMMEDTGLEYGLANENLWRPRRPVQIDRHPHNHLTRPFELLSINVRDLISLDKPREVLKQRKSIDVSISEDGSLHCLIFWIDYCLHEGDSDNSVTQSNAPKGLQGSHPCLTTHSWQQANYFPLKAQLRAGQTITLDLFLDHDDLRLEIDEDSLHGPRRISLDLNLPPGCPSNEEEEEEEGLKEVNPGGDGQELKIPAYHMCMLNDRDRTRKYQGAIKEAVSNLRFPTDLILDIGTGTGLLSMIAAKAGATNVLAFEREPSLAFVASSLINANGMSDAIDVVNQNCQEVSLGDGKAALILHEIFGTDPLSEQILPTMRFVQEAMTIPSTRFIPAQFKSFAALAWSGGRLGQVHCKAPSDEGSVDLSCIEAFVPWKVEANLVDVPGLLLLSEPSEVLFFDLEVRPLPMEGSGAVNASLCAPTSPEEYVAKGQCLPLGSSLGDRIVDCIVSWFVADMGAGGALSTAPGHTTRHGHWAQTIQFVEPVKNDEGSSAAKIIGSYQKDRCVFSLHHYVAIQ